MSRRGVSLVLVGVLGLGACSDASEPDAAPATVEASVAQPEVRPGGADVALDDASADVPIQRSALDAATAVVEVDVPGGGRLVTTLECGDAQILTVAASGVEPGVYTGVVEPSVGGDITFGVDDSGRGVGGRQGSFDAAEHTVVFEGLDGLALGIGGCG